MSTEGEADFQELYDKIGESDWYRMIYDGGSLGEDLSDWVTEAETPNMKKPQQSVSIRLSGVEMMMAVIVESCRRINNLQEGRKPRYGCKDATEWDSGLVGAFGELALAKHLNLHWNGNVGDFDAADVGHYQVRSTVSEHNKLIVHPEDKDEDVFVLCTGKAPDLCLRGWHYGMACKNKEWWWDGGVGRPAFFVPPKELEKMSLLPDLEKLNDDGPGTPLGRLKGICDFAEKECGHDPYSSRGPETTIFEMVQSLKEKVAQAEKELGREL
jgi:hypothetical protein